ncbi:antiterminator Q family protein [Erwinia amylovora]
MPENSSGLSCTDNDARIIDTCPGRLKQKHPDEYGLLVEYYIKDISKRALGRKLKLSEGIIRIKFQMAGGH